jgi:hypothetical protein
MFDNEDKSRKPSAANGTMSQEEIIYYPRKESYTVEVQTVQKLLLPQVGDRAIFYKWRLCDACTILFRLSNTYKGGAVSQLLYTQQQRLRTMSVFLYYGRCLAERS